MFFTFSQISNLKTQLFIRGQPCFKDWMSSYGSKIEHVNTRMVRIAELRGAMSS